MREIRINAGLHEALGDNGGRELAALMLKTGLVKEDVEIVGDESMPVPDLNATVFGMEFSEAIVHALESGDVGPEFKIRLPKIKIPNFVCKAACDAAAAAAVASLTLTGPALAAALAAIAIAREECRNRC